MEVNKVLLVIYLISYVSLVLHHSIIKFNESIECV